MRIKENWLFLLLINIGLWGCEADMAETPSGYVVHSLYEINGKQKIDRTGEIEPCRLEEVWVFDFQKKELLHSFDAVDCPSAPWVGSYYQPFDTGYVDSLKGRFYMEVLSNTVGASPPPLHTDFPMRFPRYEYIRNTLFYPLVKFDQEELVLRNQFDYRRTSPDTQYFELTFKYIEH